MSNDTQNDTVENQNPTQTGTGSISESDSRITKVAKKLPYQSAEEREVLAADEAALAQMRGISRRSFLVSAAVAGGAVGGLIAFNKYAPSMLGTKTLFRDALHFNEGVARRLFFSEKHLAQTFPLSAAVTPPNNYKGDTPIVDIPSWVLKLEGAEGGTQTIHLADLKKLPMISQTTELKCVEGWSKIVNWTGVPFAEFAKKYPPKAGASYVAMLSEPEDYPDEWYYVGLDIESCLHPQTLLALEMNGKPLNADHGAPLRLIMPHKYGIKNIKLITKIAYMTDRPKDYWEERGYDWYAGL